MSAKTHIPKFNQDSKTIHPSALRFAASLEVETAEAGTGVVPVSVRARSGDVVDHWYFGRCVHDFDGMQVAGEKIPFDYCHDENEILGFCDSQDTTTGELVMSGVLIPFTATDRASEIVAKSAKGQPYQGSIYFDPNDLVVEYVPEGFTSPVNGGQFDGPGVVFRQWILRGAAICPYGQDPNTSVQFSKAGDDPVSFNFSKGQQMPITKKKDQAAKKAPTKLSKPGSQKPAAKSGKMSEDKSDDKPEEMAEDEEKKPEEMADESVEEPTDLEEPCDCAGEEGCECDDEESSDTTADDTETAMAEDEDEEGKQACDDPEKMSAKSRKELGKKFLTEFGDKGGNYFASGLSLNQARAKFAAELKKENESLRKKVSAQATQLTAFRGEEEPASFSSAEEKTDKKKTKAGKFSHLPDGTAKFAATLKLNS